MGRPALGAEGSSSGGSFKNACQAWMICRYLRRFKIASDLF